VDLRNPEYDITQAIKKVLYAYQGAGELFENIGHPVTFEGYISPDERLPEVLRTLRRELESLLEELEQASGGKLSVEIRDPDAEGGELARRLEDDFGFRPMAASLFDTETFWFYMTLEGDGRVVQVPLPEEFQKADLERSLKAGLKRFSRGFLKTLALHTPRGTPPMPQFGMAGGGKQFTWLRDILAEEHNIADTDLENGQVPEEADLLMLASPEALDEKQLFAVDQFLMRGGTVVLATAPFDVDTRGTLAVSPQDAGLGAWLAHHGLTLEETMVLDPQNAAFPIPVERPIGGFVVRETQLVDYPYFVDVRGDGIDEESGIAAGIDQVTMTWPSPIRVDEQEQEGRRVVRLLQSTDQAWTSESLDIQPDFEAHGRLGFPAGEERGRQLLAVVVEGRFESFFKDKPSPLGVQEEAATRDASGEEPPEGETAPAAEAADEAKDPKEEAEGEGSTESEEPVITRVIHRSPDSARIVLFASNSFLTDDMLDLAASGLGTRYLKPVELVENAIDWSLEERGLLAIRGRAQFSRTLEPLSREALVFWEYLNYGLAVLGLLLVWLIRRRVSAGARRRHAAVLGTA
jgi:ABC-2 type transport system permease protein